MHFKAFSPVFYVIFRVAPDTDLVGYPENIVKVINSNIKIFFRKYIIDIILIVKTIIDFK